MNSPYRHNPEAVVILWADGKSDREICELTGYSRDTVFYHLRRARQCRDERAARRAVRAPYMRRRAKIRVLAQLGMASAEIASMLGCSRRLVQLRLREL